MLRKLTAEQVAAIRSDPRVYREIAEAYGVSRGFVAKIARGFARHDVPFDALRPMRREPGVHAVLGRMALGESRLVRGRTRISMKNAIAYWSRKTGFRFRAKTMTLGVRVTRIA